MGIRPRRYTTTGLDNSVELRTEKICPAVSEIKFSAHHYNDVIVGTIASQITSLMIVYSTVYSDADQRKHQSSASLAFVRGNHRGPVNSPHKWPVTRKMFPVDDVIMMDTPIRCEWADDPGVAQLQVQTIL